MIENPHAIDALGLRKDGGADLLIVSSGPLDESPETQTLLLDKVETCLAYISGPEFQAECPGASAENTRIVLRLDEEPPVLLRKLFEKIVPWTAEYGAAFAVELQKKAP